MKDKEKTKRAERRKTAREKNQERRHERQETQCNRQDPTHKPAQEAREAGMTETTESSIKDQKRGEGNQQQQKNNENVRKS